MDDYPVDLGVLRNVVPDIDARVDGVRRPRPKSRHHPPKDAPVAAPKASPEISSTRPQSSSVEKNGTMIISPSHEFDHVDALNLVKSARAAGLSLPENANYIFLTPTPSRPAAATPTAAVGNESATNSVPEASSSPRLRERRQPPTVAKKFVTKVFRSANPADTTVKVMRNGTMDSTESPKKANIFNGKFSRQKRSSPELGEINPMMAESPEEPVYEIEKILKKKKLSGKKVRYLVKWVGHEDLTWEPRTNFSSDNDAWLAFKKEQREKRSSARGNKRRSVSGEMDTTGDDDMEKVDDSDSKVVSEGSACSSGSHAVIAEKLVESGVCQSDTDVTVERSSVIDGETTAEVVADVAHQTTRAAEQAAEKTPPNSDTANAGLVSKDKVPEIGGITPSADKETNRPDSRTGDSEPPSPSPTIVERTTVVTRSALTRNRSTEGNSSKPASPVVPPVVTASPASARSVPSSAASSSATTVQTIAIQPKDAASQMAQFKPGDMVIYMPNAFARPAGSAAPSTCGNSSPRIVTVPPSRVPVSDNQAAASSQAIQTQRNRMISVRPTSPMVINPGIRFVTQSGAISPSMASGNDLSLPPGSLNKSYFNAVAAGVRPPVSRASTPSVPRQPFQPNAVSQVRSLFPSSHRTAVHLPPQQRPSPNGQASTASTPAPGWATLSPAPRAPAAVATVGIRSATPVQIRPAMILSPGTSRLTRVTKDMAVNTTLTLVSAKDVTVHAGVGKSGLDQGALVVNIAGFKPREVAITCLDDVAFLVTYANHDPEFVDYHECIRKIPHEVADFLFKNKINAVDTPPLRILT